MEAALKHLEPLLTILADHAIDQSMFTIDPSRPAS
jgi:hypothetical protein